MCVCDEQSSAVLSHSKISGMTVDAACAVSMCSRSLIPLSTVVLGLLYWLAWQYRIIDVWAYKAVASLLYTVCEMWL